MQESLHGKRNKKSTECLHEQDACQQKRTREELMCEKRAGRRSFGGALGGKKNIHSFNLEKNKSSVVPLAAAAALGTASRR